MDLDMPAPITQKPENPWIRTPLVESAPLSKIAGCRVFLKLENLQPSGSFKSRGIGNLVRTAALHHSRSTSQSNSSSSSSSSSSKPLHFYCSSGGNAGLACVTSTTTLSLPSTIVIPTSAKPHMIAKLREAGAHDIIQIGESWYEADQYLRNNLLEKENEHGIYVPPFDHEDIWTGAATMIGEIEEDLGGKADVVICSVGGGGLFCGIMQGLPDSPSTKVIAVETKGADSFAQALEKGELITLPKITSIALSLGATRVTPRALRYGLEEKERVKSVVVSDDQACGACVRFADGERMMVEPACGAALAVVYEKLLGKEGGLGLGLEKDSKVVVVVCGGMGVSFELLNEWKGKGMHGGDA